MAKVLIHHPGIDRTVEVDDAAVSTHALAGWVLCDDEGEPIEGWTPEPDQVLAEVTEPLTPGLDALNDLDDDQALRLLELEPDDIHELTQLDPTDLAALVEITEPATSDPAKEA